MRKILLYIITVIILVGCQEREFISPYDPFTGLSVNPSLSYSGTESNQLKINTDGIDPKSFKRYEVYISRIADFLPSTDNLFRIVTKFDSTRVLLNNLEENESYFIRVKFVDVLDRTALTDAIKIVTGNDEPPKPIISNNSTVEFNKIVIRWNRSLIKDFLKYELYFSTIKNFPFTTVNLYRTITVVGDTSVSFENLKPNTEYYFKVRLYDKGNLYSDSDEKTMKTGNDIPVSVILEDTYNPTESSMDLKWTKNADEDFLKYEIHYSNNPNFTISSQTLLRTVTDQNTTSATVNGLLASRQYFFKIRVVDKGGLYNDSNEKSGITSAPSGSDVPKAVTLNQPADITQTTMRISWSQYLEDDFKHYELHYSTEPNFILSSSNMYIGALTMRTTINLPVYGLQNNTKYYFRVRIVNTKDKFSDSQEVSASTLP